MNVDGSRVLVTGGGGFIGSHLVEELVARGCSVRAFVHYNSRSDWGNLEHVPRKVLQSVEIVPGDIVDPFSVRSAVDGCEVVFHLAALIGIPYSYVAPHSYVQTNVVGTTNVMEACRQCGVSRVVHTSTSETYGTARYVPIDEGHPLQGQSPYSASKIAADKMAESYHRAFALPVITVRPFNTFGPRQSARAVIPTIISQLLTEAPTLSLGSLTPVRDFTYVKDTVAAFVSVANSDAAIGEVLNVGNGKGITIGQLVELISGLLGRPEVDIVCESYRVRPDLSEVMQLIASNEHVKRLTGWEPKWNLTDGLAETIAFIRDHPQLFKPSRYTV
ncbi:MAG: GDP-mannose 4,6-dehydratase [Gemmatimonadota bacterium]